MYRSPSHVWHERDFSDSVYSTPTKLTFTLNSPHHPPHTTITTTPTTTTSSSSRSRQGYGWLTSSFIHFYIAFMISWSWLWSQPLMCAQPHPGPACIPRRLVWPHYTLRSQFRVCGAPSVWYTDVSNWSPLKQGGSYISSSPASTLVLQLIVMTTRERQQQFGFRQSFPLFI